MIKHRTRFQILYDSCLAMIAFISFLIVAASFFSKSISLKNTTILNLMHVFLIIYAVDFFARMPKNKNAHRYLFDNTFDLLSLIPLHPAFAIFRIGRVFKLIRSHHLLWRFGLDGKFSKTVHRFIYTSGFLNLFTVSMIILVLSSLLYSVVEHISYPSALWWAITTATTVGYGDISPTTNIGKFIAAFLMIGGVGFIGLLTSTITGFFTSEAATQEDDMTKLFKKIDQLDHKIDHLQRQLNLERRKNTRKK
ncbi:ion channel [Pediococcus pentosaceus]|uniref:Kef-type K+ transport system, predicted NAD-binding component n=1 Tax=Pediococcus pentosaceus (strain ATCC 25745 / CCUG 21536 / LMG 10740 / 183-1w) TaxID=278197 RepID=Q03HC5_PEDPA|nr:MULTISPECIES: potassium channel family protein [Pediococcus]ABJ67397.1 Kef-type K+ transport system, predicted NAD-binding component [Pediococcus pentosaceus ATCC 25745]KAF5439068.1 potassium channel family protein [Pediococcus sp. EKM202D]KAF5439270.1 potassium channel family protein [Pediococcus sp. EKM201D]QHM65050.1 pH-gated potassium channel KcsA [Pediococcus pentosaceus]QHM66769.1 pH-gated potassium channel KcsA [Pediococcus pentosaceus]